MTSRGYNKFVHEIDHFLFSLSPFNEENRASQDARFFFCSAPAEAPPGGSAGRNSFGCPVLGNSEAGTRECVPAFPALWPGEAENDKYRQENMV